MTTLLDNNDEYELERRVWVAVHNLVDDMLADVHPDNDEAIRQRLTEQFRFWRRVIRHDR